jgi:Ser-tRNA(Ala) deacylase AlaX
MTHLLYLQDPTRLKAECRIAEYINDPDGAAVVLDVTPFYPKGGGQPSDTGRISGGNGGFFVSKVYRADDGKILHYGHMDHGCLAVGDQVSASVDAETRRLHSRLHTAGEVICAALHELGIRWPVTAASHVPGQSRVAFAAGIDASDLPAFTERFKERFEEIIARDERVVTLLGVDCEEAKRLCPMDSGGMAEKTGEIRLVSPVAGFYRPCMGAHLQSTGEVGKIDFRKVRLKKGELSISYDLAQD